MLGLVSLRAEYPVLRETAYLNAGTDGPIPQRSVDAAAERMRGEAERGRGMASHWDELSELRAELRARYAALIRASAEEVALTRSTTDGVDVALAGLRLGRGDEVLTSDEEHVGLLAPLAGFCARSGAALRTGPFADLPNAVGPQTRLVAVSHVSWMTGAFAPLGELREAAPLLLLDGAQGAGAVPVDVRTLG
jgi:L-cysteine/cystine lyase